jgi:hypothetical protein
MKIAVIGSGFAGFGATIALVENPKISIDLYDIGLKTKLENQPDKAIPNAKTHHGTFFTYGINDPRWSVKLTSERICSSHALGGHSTVYSGSILYPKENDLHEWPTESRPRAIDYQSVLTHISVLHAQDMLDEEFPVIPTEQSVQKQLDCEVQSLLGYSRIAVEKNTENSRNKKIFSTKEYFQDLIQKKRIGYITNVFVLEIKKSGDKQRLLIEDENGKKELTVEYDAIFVGAGCLNTTGIVDRSLHGVGTRKYYLKSPSGIICAFLRLKFATSQNHKIRKASNLPEFFLETKSPALYGTWSHTQITAINEQIISAITSKIFFFRGFFANFFRNLVYFSLTSFHSRLSPVIAVIKSTTSLQDDNFQYSIKVEEPNESSPPAEFRQNLFHAVRKHWRILRLIPIPFGSFFADFFRGNKLGGWHYGGTLPIKQNPQIGQCHPNGEIEGLSGVYVIDSSSFPEIPASTIVLLSSANAHRVARQWLKNA